MNKEFVQAMSAYRMHIRSVQSRLESLSSAFGATGNTVMSDKLYGMAELLDREFLTLDQAFSDSLYEMVKQSESNLGLALATTLSTLCKTKEAR